MFLLIAWLSCKGMTIHCLRGYAILSIWQVLTELIG